MSNEVLLDLSFLTEEERDLISNVISKDAGIRKQEQNRISTLRKELDRLKEDGLPEDQLESKNENYCARCQTYFGIILNKGAFCPRCELKVCKVCREKDTDEGWICTLCFKVRQVKAQSGAWFFQGHKEKTGNLFGSMLVRQSLRRLPGSYSSHQKEIQASTFVSPREELEGLHHFTAPINHIRGSERLSGQDDQNSNQAQRNGNHKLGYQYSDDSDADSEQGSLEDNHDTASDKTLSKGESDSSESLDSDHDETATNTPTKTPFMEPQSMSLGGNLLQQGLARGKEGDDGVFKDTQAIRSRPTSYNPDAEITYPKQQDGGNHGQKGVVGETKHDEVALKDTQKARSQPSISSLDEDISYVAAPRFTIPSKRRQYSDSEDTTLKPEARSVLEKHRSKSEEYLHKSDRQENKPSTELIVEAKGTRSETKDQNIADILEDVFDIRKEHSAPYNIEAGASSEDETRDEHESVGEGSIEFDSDNITPKVDCGNDELPRDNEMFNYSIHEDAVYRESRTVVESSPESNNPSADYIVPEPVSARDEVILDTGKLSYNEDVMYKESEIVVESSPDEGSHGYYKPNTMQLNIKNDKIPEHEAEIPSTDDFEEDSDSASSSENAIDIPGNDVGESDDDESTETMSILARVKNWEKKSNEDRFGGRVTRSNTDMKKQDISNNQQEMSNNRGVKFGVRVMPVGRVGGSVNTDKTFGEAAKIDNAEKSGLIKSNDDIVKEEAFDNESKRMKSQYEISPELSDEELAVSVSTDEDMEEKLSEDLSPIVNASIENQTSMTGNEVESVTDIISSSDTVKPPLNLEQTGPSEDFSPMVNAFMEDQTSTTVNEVESVPVASTDPTTLSDTVEPSLNLEKTELELQKESSYDDEISPDNIKPDDAIHNHDFPPKDITTHDMQPEDSEFETNQHLVSLDTAEENMSEPQSEPEQDKPDVDHELSSGISNLDFSSSNTDSSFKTGDNFTSSPLQSDTFVDTEVPRMSARYEQPEPGPNPFDSEEDTQKSGDEGAVELRRDEVISERNQYTDVTDPIYDEPYSSETNVDQPANEEDPASSDSRVNALQAFSETFVSANFGMKRSDSRENRSTDLDFDTKLDETHLNIDKNREDRVNLEDRENFEDRDYREDRVDHDYGEDRRSSKSSSGDRGTLEDRGTREDRYYREDHRDSEGPDSRRSSELHYEGFHGDNESMISETSGYGTPSTSEDTSSKRTTSISGDEGRRVLGEEAGIRRPPSESTPVIVTTEVDDYPSHNRQQNNNRNSSITDYEEDLDVSFSKFEGGLGTRKLKDQLSMGSRESIVSYYSNAGGEVYGKYPVSGEILFGVKYDPKIQEFQIQIHQGRDITAVDKKSNTSDPYVKTYLLPDRSRTGKRKSKVKKHTINPVFDEILTYKISYDEILQRTLWLAIWNHDTFGHNDFLGEVLVPIDEYHQSGFSLEDPEPQWYELCERQAEDPQFSYNGEIVFALKYVPPSALVSSKKKKKKKKGEEEKGELHVNIIEASNLLAKDANGFSDPFCKSYLLPDKSKKTKQKTAVVKKSLNPKWNYHFVYDNVTHEELMDRVLELTVWDFDRGSSNEFLGGVRLGLGAGLQEWDDSSSEEQAAWNKMLNNQNDWNQMSLTLREHMGSYK